MTRARRVVIADDHAASRVGVREALELGGFVVVREVYTGLEAVQAAVEERPDVCLLDIYMPGDGIAAARAITAQVPGTAVVMLTVSAQDEDLLAAIRAGASGYLLKTMDARRLPLALHGVLRGEAAIPRVLVARLLDEVRERAGRRQIPFLRDRTIQLTPREWQVLELMSQELPTQEIAARLGISTVTVRRHVSQLLRKLDAPDRKTILDMLKPEAPEDRDHPAAVPTSGST